MTEIRARSGRCGDASRTSAIGPVADSLLSALAAAKAAVTLTTRLLPFEEVGLRVRFEPNACHLCSFGVWLEAGQPSASWIRADRAAYRNGRIGRYEPPKADIVSIMKVEQKVFNEEW